VIVSSPAEKLVSTHNILALAAAIVDDIWLSSSQLSVTLNTLDNASYQQILTNGFLLRCLSSQYVLRLERNSRMSISAKLAWITLNLKMLTSNFWQILQSISKAADQSAFRPEVGQNILGAIRWALDILTYVLQDLMDLKHAIGPSPSLASIQSYLTTHASPALHLTLCSLTRFFLRHFITSLRKFYNLGRENLKKAAPSAEAATASKPPNGPDPARAALWMRFMGAFAAPLSSTPTGPPGAAPLFNLIMNSNALDDFFKGIDVAMRTTYDATGISDRGAAERALFVRAPALPDYLAPTIHDAVLGATDGLMEYVQPGSLFRADVAWLSLTEEASEMVVDVVRKGPMGRGSSGRVKRCPRCRSVSEEIEIPQVAQVSLGWLVQAMRQCVCTNSWTLHEEGVGAK
jgi:Mediator complex subunit 16